METKKRADVDIHDQWDLSSLFASEADWEQGVLRLKEYTKEAPT